MFYRLSERKNPLNRSESAKWYVTPVYAGTRTLEDVASEITERSSLTHGDVLSTLRNTMEVIPKFLKMGYIVDLGDLGRFRLIPSSEGVATQNDFDVHKIKRLRMFFSPGKSIKKALADTQYTTLDK
ncbi:MAG: hypothetical protein Ta2A_18710 [Treponemataceae bacterium]|nr:MAG: hypothetical protein Ta2A_18710 [Treponemataceae bacterium]